MKVIVSSFRLSNRWIIAFILSFIFSLPVMCASLDDDIESLTKAIKRTDLSEPSTPKEEKKERDQAPNTVPRSSKKIDFDVSLSRYKDKTKTGLYFSKAAELVHSGVVVSAPSMETIFGENSHTKIMDDFLVSQVKTEKTDGWKRNHLAVSLFVTVNDLQSETIRCIEGSLLVEEISEVDRNVYYDFSISPKDKSLNGRKVADFVSSPVTDDFSSTISGRGYVPVWKSALRPINDKDNHGDRLALDTVCTNLDLFFSLIRRSAHREDLPITGMGIRFYSSYDACDNCFQQIYTLKTSLNLDLVNFAKGSGYPIKDEDNFPLSCLFYSTRPYKESSYTLGWKIPDNKKSYHYNALKPKYVFPKGQGIVYHPTYHFELPKFPEEHSKYFARKNPKSLSLLGNVHTINSNFIYSYVAAFEPGGLPIEYRNS